MNVSESLYAQLVALNTAASTRVYFSRLPQEEIDARSLLPSITYKRVSDTRDVLLVDGKSGIARPRFQVSCWAFDPSDAENLRQQVIDGLTGFLGLLGGTGGVNVQGILFAGATDLDDPIAQLYHLTSDFFIPHNV